MKDNYDFSNAKPILSAEELRKRLMDCCKELKEYQMAADAEAKIVDRKHAEIQQLTTKNEKLVEALADIRNRTLVWAKGTDKGRDRETELLRVVHAIAQQAIEENGK